MNCSVPDCDCEPIVFLCHRHLGRKPIIKKTINKRRRKLGLYLHVKYPSEYGAWVGMRTRCNNPNSHMFQNYGGRGIRVDSEWKDFEKFLNYIGPKPAPEYTLERINNNGNYEPGNVRWATRTEQNNNTRRTIFIEKDGEIHTMKEWAAIVGINYNVVKNRKNTLGWSAYEAVFSPSKPRKAKNV